MKNYLIIILLVIFIACSKDNGIYEGNNCPVTKVVNSEFNSVQYEFIYDDNNKLTHIIDFNNSLPNGFTYYLNYKSNNSIIVNPMNFNGGISDVIYMELKYNGNKIVEVREYEGAPYLFKFEYEGNRIRVSQMYMSIDFNNNIEYSDTAYGDYFLDSNGNVFNAKWYTYNSNNIDATLSSDINYSYDNYPNPWKGIIFPTFRNEVAPWPLPIFFSNNNITSIAFKNGGFRELNNEYSGQHIVKGGYFQQNENYYYKCQ